MQDNTSFLRGLIGYGLFGGPNPFREQRNPHSVVDWQMLFDESRRQAVTALLHDAILMLPKEQRPSRKELFHFMSLTQTVESDNRLREEALVAFHEEVTALMGVPTVVVKGSSMAGYYPNPLHRECGDNDLYTGVDTEQVVRRLETMGVAVDRKDPRHASFTYHDVDFEAHNYLLYHGDDPHWNTTPLALKGQKTNVDGLLHLPAEEEAYFLAKHIEHHAVFFHKPVRLRDLVDWSLLLGVDGFDMNRLRVLKKGSDVEHFAELMSLACNEFFGLRIDCHPPAGLDVADFERLYMQCPERHRLSVVRVVRRSWKYLRYGRQYRILYGQSMFGRFYFRNIFVAIRNIFQGKGGTPT